MPDVPTPTVPTVPTQFQELRKHPSISMQANHGWLNPRIKSPAERQYGGGTGNPWMDFLVKMTGQVLIPPAPAATFARPSQLRPDVELRVGPQYMRAMGRASNMQSVMDQLHPGLLNQLGRSSPSMQPYMQAARTALQDPALLQQTPGLAGILPML